MTGDSSPYSVVPEALCEVDQWVCWRAVDREGKVTKIPVEVASGEFASTADQASWCSFDAAVSAANRPNVDGIGFVFTETDDFVGIDLDDCRGSEYGEVDTDAREIIDRVDSYTEVSPSGTGFHVLAKGEIPDGRSRNDGVEMYDSGRFFTVTGLHVSGTPTEVRDRSTEIRNVHSEFVGEDTTSTAHSTVSNHSGSRDHGGGLSDSELLVKARQAANGEKFQRLWHGDTTGYDSQSEADMALCFMLAFWTGGDPLQMDRLFRQSGLMREKWETIHFGDGSTYGEKTIARAISRSTEFYEPSKTEYEYDINQEPHCRGNQLNSDTSSASVNSHRVQSCIDSLESTVEHLEMKVQTLEQEVDEIHAKLEAEQHRLKANASDYNRSKSSGVFSWFR